MPSTRSKISPAWGSGKGEGINGGEGEEDGSLELPCLQAADASVDDDAAVDTEAGHSCEDDDAYKLAPWRTRYL
jgi:hypothetical protein